MNYDIIYVIIYVIILRNSDILYAVLGTGFIVIFGDAIICAMIVTFIIKAFRKKK